MTLTASTRRNVRGRVRLRRRDRQPCRDRQQCRDERRRRHRLEKDRDQTLWPAKIFYYNMI
jgi:hypothetical protein